MRKGLRRLKIKYTNTLGSLKDCRAYFTAEVEARRGRECCLHLTSRPFLYVYVYMITIYLAIYVCMDLSFYLSVCLSVCLSAGKMKGGRSGGWEMKAKNGSVGYLS